mmetsp:Transcript_18327/g.52347  ORF Transcript_18327/g.52347 Transcript_18327/m.52347 type:complete len:532 (-) Transcript_18327:208-1803(-)
MLASQPAEALRAALVRQFGASARSAIDAEIDSRLAQRKKLGREDVDAIEEAVLAAVRKRRNAGPNSHALVATGVYATPSTPTRPLYASASAPELAPRSPQRRLPSPSGGRGASVATPSSHRPSTMGAVVAVDFSTDWGRAALRRPTQVPPKRRDPDHFDLMTRYADEQHQRGAEARLEKQRAQLAAFRAGLDAQLEERRLHKEQEEAEDRQWGQILRGRAENFRREQEQEAAAKAQQVQVLRRRAANDMELISRRKDRADNARRQERLQLDTMLEQQKKHDDCEAEAKKALNAKRAKDARELFEAAAKQREAKKNAENEESLVYASETKRRSEQQEAAGNEQYKKRQAVVDSRMATLGKAYADLLARKEREAQDRIDREHEEWKQTRLNEFWQSLEAEQKVRKGVSAMNLTMGATRRAEDGMDEKAANLEQLKQWTLQTAKHDSVEQAKAKQAFRRREEMDDSCLRTIHRKSRLHKSEIGVTEQERIRELLYNKKVLDRMAAEGFKPDLTSTLLIKASNMSSTLRGPKAHG